MLISRSVIARWGKVKLIALTLRRLRLGLLIVPRMIVSFAVAIFFAVAENLSCKTIVCSMFRTFRVLPAVSVFNHFLLPLEMKIDASRIIESSG